MFVNDPLLDRLILWIILVLSLTVHEWAHAYSAWLLGDDTAKLLGRCTLDPLAHIDPIGTLLPLLGIPFGWAKPVPINPLRFRRVGMRTGVFLTAAAGPASNVALLLILAGGVFATTRLVDPEVLRNGPILQVFFVAMTLNLLLACFNLIPIYPLDGSRIVESLLPHPLRGAWLQFCRLSPILLLALLLGPRLLHFDLFALPRNWAYALFVAMLP